MAKNITREELERVARMYKTNRDACAALHISYASFIRFCRQYDIEPPNSRRQRLKREVRRH